MPKSRPRRMADSTTAFEHTGRRHLGSALCGVPAQTAIPIAHGSSSEQRLWPSVCARPRAGCGRYLLEALCSERARTWFGGDRDSPVSWEPSGADFLPPALIEAELMRRVLPQSEFAVWLAAFLPGLVRREPATLFSPADVTDRTDPFIVHLDGLNFSRAWCLRGIASALPESDPRTATLRDSGVVHLRAGMEGLAGGDCMGEHWLATFATLALTQ